MPYPAKRNPRLVDDVLARIASGETLAALGKELGFHPTSWGDWVAADEALAVAYQRARDTGSDALAEQALALIDEEPPRVEGRVDPGHVQWRRAQVDTRLKLLACWNPKKYGSRQTLEHSGVDGKPIEVAHADVGQLARNLRAIASGQAEPVPIEAQPAKLLGSDLL
jgi:hypothetical protein